MELLLAVGLGKRPSASPTRSLRCCCEYRFKLYHRHSDACQLDVLVLAQSSAPFMHGEAPLWPPQILLAQPVHALETLMNQGESFFAIPEDVHNKLLMSDDARWCKAAGEWSWCGGPPVSYFQDEYFIEKELFPVKWVNFYDFEVPLPADPWSSLNRTYGPRCSYIARLSEHGSIEFDTRLAPNAHLNLPASVQLVNKTVQASFEQRMVEVQQRQQVRVEQEAEEDRKRRG
jgi:hypothetical protein